MTFPNLRSHEDSSKMSNDIVSLERSPTDSPSSSNQQIEQPGLSTPQSAFDSNSRYQNQDNAQQPTSPSKSRSSTS